MKKLTALLIASLILFCQPAMAGINGLNDPQLEITPPTTPADLLGLIGCQNYTLIIDDSAGVEYIVQNCSGSSYTLQQFWPPLASNLTNDTGFITSSSLAPYLLSATAASTYFQKPTGTSLQYLDGTGAAQSFAAPVITHPTRALNTCFQPSASAATSFTYSVDISAGIISLGGGTALVTQYNDSACTTGALAIANGAVSSVALGGTSSIPLVSATASNKYLKITATSSGGASAAIDSVTTEKQ